jgi:AraC-like DNA-binding protein
MPAPADFPVANPLDSEMSPLSSPMPFLHRHDSLQVGFCTAGAEILREQPNRPITDVAFAVGFESMNTLNRQFLKIVSRSPRHGRQHTAAPPLR